MAAKPPRKEHALFFIDVFAGGPSGARPAVQKGRGSELVERRVDTPPDERTEEVGTAAENVLGLDLDALVVDVRRGINTTLDEF